jgi:hypothetical protein
MVRIVRMLDGADFSLIIISEDGEERLSSARGDHTQEHLPPKDKDAPTIKDRGKTMEARENPGN